VALADGGEGLVDALASQLAGAFYVDAKVRGPRAEEITARFGVAGPPHNATAILEMAASSGLSLVPEAQRDPKITTTLGVGDQIRAALDLQNVQVKRLLIGIGGSATNDGGAGMARALGARLLDAHGNDLPDGGAALARLARIDISQLERRLKNVELQVACDVKNPLCGKNGASFVYGPQKGASTADVALLDAALEHYAEIIERDLGEKVRDVPGAGAAGGLGAGLLAFCKAKLVSGIDLVLDTIGFDELLDNTSFVVTGEGRLDTQTLMGKAPLGVAQRAAKKQVPCVAIGGDFEMACRDELHRYFQRIESLREFAGSVERAKAHAADVLEALAFDHAREWFEVKRER